MFEWMLSYPHKSSILDIWLGFEYVSTFTSKQLFPKCHD